MPASETNRQGRRVLLALIVVAGLLPGLWWARAAAFGADTTEAAAVTMRDVSFSPATVRIRAGQTVTWSNPTKLTHTATGAGFNSGNVAPGGSWSHKFTKAGTYSYVCVPHQAAGMRGTVIVE